MTVDRYIARLPQPQRNVAAALRKIIQSATPDARDKSEARNPNLETNSDEPIQKNPKQCLPLSIITRSGFLKLFRISVFDFALLGTGKSVRYIKIRVLPTSAPCKSNDG